MVSEERKITQLYTSQQIAEKLGRSLYTVSHVAPRYASYQLGGRWIWTDEDAERYRAKQRTRKE